MTLPERESAMIGLAMLLMADFTTFHTGRDLSTICQKDRAACTRYIEGASDMVSSLQAMKSMPTNVCVDPSATGAELVDITKTFLAEHSDSLDDDAGKLVWAALYGAFPCSNKGVQ
jgi:hypothetical protein